MNPAGIYRDFIFSPMKIWLK